MVIYNIIQVELVKTYSIQPATAGVRTNPTRRPARFTRVS